MLLARRQDIDDHDTRLFGFQGEHALVGDFSQHLIETRHGDGNVLRAADDSRRPRRFFAPLIARPRMMRQKSGRPSRIVAADDFQDRAMLGVGLGLKNGEFGGRVVVHEIGETARQHLRVLAG